MSDNYSKTKKLELWYPIKPVTVNQPFGVNGDYYRSNGIPIVGHNGIDFGARDYQPVRAAHDGEVVYAGVDNREGYGVVIRTTEKYEYGDGECWFKTIYWHLIPNIPVRVGQKVAAGDIVGYADNTGLSTGTHLHFGLKPVKMGEEGWIWTNLEQNNGYLGAIDPQPFFNGYYAEDAQTVLSVLKQQIALYQKVFEILKILVKGRK